MPTLRLFGHKWLVGTDDFVIPCTVELFLRVIWVSFIGYIICRWYDFTDKCKSEADFIKGNEGYFVKVYLIGLLVILLINIILLIAIINRSSQGSICEVHKRKAVPYLLYCKILLLLPEAGWNGLGTILAYTRFIWCPHVTMTINVPVILDWLFLVLIVFALYLLLDPVGSVKLDTKRPDFTLDMLKHEKMIRVWTRRFRCLACWLLRDKETIDAVSEIAGLFDMLFRDSELTPTDMLAGAILLRVKTKQETREQVQIAEKRDKYSTDLKEVFRGRPSWMNLRKAFTYMRLSMATYTYGFVFYRNCCIAPCLLLRQMRCCMCCRKKHPVLVRGDNCCGCHMAGLKHLGEIRIQDCIYCDFKNKIFKVPICIIAEHETKSVVVAIRGTISLIDCLTDVVAGAEKLNIEGLPEGSMAHKGMLIGAKNVKQHLDETKYLDKALSTYPTYKLIFTGHSLGAAIAVLVGLMFKPKHPDLKVFAFSCPSVLTLPAAVYCESFTFTFGVGDDFAMRASLDKTEKLRSQLFEVLQKSKLPKYRVIIYGLGYALYGIPSKHLTSMWSDRPLLFPAPNEVPYMLTKVATRKCTDVALYPAGTILHVLHKKPKEKSCPSKCLSGCCFCLKCLFCCGCCFCCCKKKNKKSEDKRYEMGWVKPDFFNELKVMPRMLLDHLPENVYKVIGEILEDEGIEIDDYEEYIIE